MSCYIKHDIILATVILILLPQLVLSQNPVVELSKKHQDKLSRIESGHKRLVKFYKYYKQDSTLQAKRLERRFKKSLDSASRAVWKRARLEEMPVGKRQRLLKKELGQYDPKRLTKIDSGSVSSVANKLPGYDTLAGFITDPNMQPSLLDTSKFSKESMTQNLPKDFLPEDNLPINEPLEDVHDIQNKIEKAGNEKEKQVLEEALSRFQKQEEKLQAAQSKVSRLLSKYKEFSNSNDLGNAVKRTSLKGKTFWERLVIAGNFNLISTSPVSIDLSPQLGYKFNTNFYVGVGYNYRHTFKDSIESNWYVSPSNSGHKLFANYDVVKSFFVYSEWERRYLVNKENDKLGGKDIKDNYFIGIGKRLLIHSKLYMNISMLYNLNSEAHNPIHPRRFQVRIGFQLSELAIRKNRPAYDPNRHL